MQAIKKGVIFILRFFHKNILGICFFLFVLSPTSDYRWEELNPSDTLETQIIQDKTRAVKTVCTLQYVTASGDVISSEEGIGLDDGIDSQESIDATDVDIPQAVIEEPDTIKLTLLGDVCFGTSYGNRGRFDTYFEEQGPSYFFEDVQEGYKDSDYVIANLENVFTDLSRYQKGKIYTYKASPKYLSILEESGITNVAVVNNHMHDYLQAGFDDSTTRLEDVGINWFGSMSDLPGTVELGSIDVDQKNILDCNGFKIGLVSYYGFNGSFRTDTDIDNDIAALRSEGVAYIIAYVHWGGQNDHNITSRQTVFGHKLIDKGVDLIIGSHPHAVQKIEIYEGKHIYYSLGDSIFFHRKTPVSPDGLMVHLELSRDNEGLIVENFENVPILWAGSECENIYKPIYTTEPKALERANGYLLK